MANDQDGPLPPSEIAAKLATLSNGELAALRGNLRPIIDQRIAGITYAEQRRGQLLVAGVALLAGGIALLPLSSASGNRVLRFAFVTGAIGLITLGLLVVWVYARQTNYPYPFVAPSQTRKWYYHHALPNKAAFGIPWWRRKKEPAKKEASAYEEQLGQFAPVQIELLSNDKRDATEDILQLFLLHVNERYKNFHLTELRRVLARGLTVIVTATVLAALIGLSFTDSGPDTSAYTRRGVGVESEWKPTGATKPYGADDHQTELLVAFTVTTSDARVRFERVRAVESDGLAVPIQSVGALPSIPADTIQDFAITVWVPSSLVDDLERFELID